MSARGPPVPWTPGAATALWRGILSLLGLYAVGALVGFEFPDGSATYKAYCTMAFFATFAFVGFIVGLGSAQRPYRNATIVVGVSLAALILTLREGIACVMMSLPLVLPLLYAGAKIGFTLRKRAHLGSRSGTGLMILAFLISAGWEWQAARHNDPAQHPLHRVESSLAVAAPPERVFDALMDMQLRRPPPAFLRVGLPIPQRLRVVKPGLGGEVDLTYASMDVQAVITAWEPGRRLAFTPTRYHIADRRFFHTRLGSVPGLKQDPVTDWLTFEDLAYDLTPLPNGGTLVHRVTVFRRHLFPDLYFGWLEPLVIRKGQEHLLQGIRDAVEGGPNGDLSVHL